MKENEETTSAGNKANQSTDPPHAGRPASSGPAALGATDAAAPAPQTPTVRRGWPKEGWLLLFAVAAPLLVAIKIGFAKHAGSNH